MSFVSDRITKKQTLLNEVDQAISFILTGGQEYKLSDQQVEQMVKQGDLNALRNLQKQLEMELASYESTGGFYAS